MSRPAPAIHPALDPDILSGFHLVEADAGTGKTWTLVALVVRALVERSLGVEQILLVTFTRAAAAELRGRLRDRIERVLAASAAYPGSVSDDPVAALLLGANDPADVTRRLRLALARIDEAPIDTIHGFCQRIISEHGLSVGLPGRFEIDEWGGRALTSEMVRWWSATMAREPLELVQLLGAGGGPSPETVGEMLAPLLVQPDLELRPGPFDWRSLATQVSEQRDALLAALAEEGDAFADWCKTSSEVNRRSYSSANVANWLEAVRRFAADLPRSVGNEKATAFARLGSDAFGAGPAPGGFEDFTFPRRLSDLLSTLRMRKLVAAAICHELRDPLAARLRERRELTRTLSFDDLLRITRDALTDPVVGAGLAAQLRRRYPLALIDECQDTDPLQWQIFAAIYPRSGAAGQDGSDEPAMVMVGDPKQAIYGFRNADVYAYFDARSGARLHRIAENRRASEPLLAAIGALFDCPAPFLIDEIEMHPPRYGERPRPQLLAPPGAAPRAAFNWVRLSADGDRRLSKEDARQRAARACAAEIARLLGEPRTLVRWPAPEAAGNAPGAERELALQPRDIAVLVGTAYEAGVIKRALTSQGIGAAEISRQSVFESREARELVRVITAVASPSSSSRLRGALVTGLIGWSAEQLEEVAGDERAWSRIVAAFEACARAWPRRGAQAALRALLLDDLEVAGRVAAGADGERALTNLAHLLDLMSESAASTDSPAAALAWLDEAQGAGIGGEAHELRLESDDNLVQVVTVHKSKGLEFPLVFVPFAWSLREARTAAGALPLLRYHERDGERWLAVRELDSSSGDSLAARLAAREEASEALRLLYVALTRAQLRVYLFWGDVSGAERSPLGWLLRDRAACDDERPDWQASRLVPEALAEHVARAGEGALELSFDEVIGERAHFIAPEPEGIELAARPFTVDLAPGWVRRSFTAIARGSSGDAGDRPDHDQAVTPEPAALAGDEPPGAGADQGPSASSGGDPGEAAHKRLRFGFERGAHAGYFLHGLLEATDFASGVDPDQASRQLERNAIVAEAGATAHWLDEVLATPLADGRGGQIDLRALGRDDRIVELPFLLPVDAVADEEIFAAISAHYPLDLQRGREAWSGFLNGFIDLVYRHDGRYFLLDWKSNWLGGDFGDYRHEALEAEIRHGSYALQFCLYALALHRWLQRRVAGYRYDEHFGGVHYAFLRGMAPAARDPDGGQYGVYFTCPPRALIERLDGLLGGVER